MLRPSSCIAAVFAIVVACGYPDIEGTPIAGSKTIKAATEPSIGACEGPKKLEKMDPSTLPPCCDGAHCVPTEKVPGKVRAKLSQCPGGFCVPDAFLTSGGAPAPSCKSVGDKDGACISVCVPEVERNKALLPQGTCAANEKCAPCISPLTQQSTGVCELGKDDDDATCDGDGGAAADAGPLPCPHVGPPVLDPTTLPPCDGAAGNVAGAHCLETALVPAAMAAKLADCSKGKCVPDTFIASGGRFIPKTCTGPGLLEGRCLHQSLPDIAKKADKLSADGCESFERCAPCFDPITGADTGACKQSCDPGPTKPAVKFADCCVKGGAPRGRCVPKQMVPDTQEQQLSKDTCAGADDICVPSENLQDDFLPLSCTGDSPLYLPFGKYSGVCLSTCLVFSGIDGLVVKQGNCDSLHQCVPCKDPLGKATGAPGCN